LIIIPRLPLMILLAAYAGASLATTILVIGLLGWPQLARVVRVQVLSLRRRPHVNAARLFGASAPYVIRRHLIPALLPILAAGFVTHAGHAVMMEAGLAFLGLGDPTMKSWGLTIRYALNVKGFFFGDQWLWWILPAGFNLAMLLMAFAFVGIGLEAVANPRIRRHR
jgi:ABC-type dipeptide/oligopeptide/nickel transport system permease subunit